MTASDVHPAAADPADGRSELWGVGGGGLFDGLVQDDAVAQVIGFAVAGVLVAIFGARQALAIDAATFALSAALVRLTVHRRPAPTLTDGHTGSRGLRAGIRVVFGDRWLRSLTLLAWLDAFLVGGPTQVGILLAAIAAGSTLGVLAAA